MPSDGADTFISNTHLASGNILRISPYPSCILHSRPPNHLSSLFTPSSPPYPLPDTEQEDVHQGYAAPGEDGHPRNTGPIDANPEAATPTETTHSGKTVLRNNDLLMLILEIEDNAQGDDTTADDTTTRDADPEEDAHSEAAATENANPRATTTTFEEDPFTEVTTTNKYANQRDLAPEDDAYPKDASENDVRC